MHLRWKSSFRVRSGWFLGLAYLFCVLAPGAALALGSGPAPCLENQAPLISAPMTHQHGGKSPHDHGGMHAHHHSDAGSSGQGHHGKTSPGPCCAMMCATALPASLPMIATPLLLISICASDPVRQSEGKVPPLLYRPPIA